MTVKNTDKVLEATGGRSDKDLDKGGGKKASPEYIHEKDIFKRTSNTE